VLLLIGAIIGNLFFALHRVASEVEKSIPRMAGHLRLVEPVRLGISQPAISQQMRDLETALRVSLFQRRGKRILPTSAGLIFQEHARVILRQLENFLQELGGELGELRGALHVGVIPILNVALMPDLLGLFAAKHPGISLTVEEISSTEINGC